MKRKLLKRKDFDIFRKGDKYCGVCGMVLDTKKEEDGFYWCPKCKLFRWAKQSINYPTRKYYQHWVDEIATLKMRDKMDKYADKVSIELRKSVTIYTSDDNTQEVLKSLIPKR